MKRKSASKKLLPLMLILMLILGISMPANAAVNPRLNSTKKVLYVGKTSQLKVVNWKKAVKWSSSNNKVVKVSSKGKITAVKTGTATVKARIAKKTLTCKVTVKSPGMSVKKAVLYVKGKSLQLKVNGVSGKTVWSSANKKIVKVSSKGKITAVKKGKTAVTVTDKKSGETTSADVYVLGEEDVTFPQIETQNYSTVTLKSNGEIWSYGYNGYGQLGTGDTTYKV